MVADCGYHNDSDRVHYGRRHPADGLGTVDYGVETNNGRDATTQ